MCVDLYSSIFKVNKKNYLNLSDEFDFAENDGLYIYRTFRPIIEVETFETSEISTFLIDLKNEFITSNKTFNLKIFKRQNLDVSEHYLKTYLDCLEREKYKIWDFRKEKYFYHLKIEDEKTTPRHQTLLISDYDPTQLEIYFIEILEEIKKFIDTPIKDISNNAEINPTKEGLTENNPTPKAEEKYQKIQTNLNKYKFDELPMTLAVDLNILIKFILAKSLPYQIAYLNYLNFIKHLEDNYCDSQIGLHQLLSKILSQQERAIRGNINGLRNEKSTDRKRYTAHIHVNKVKEHYLTLK
jgi:hypothetical protein